MREEGAGRWEWCLVRWGECCSWIGRIGREGGYLVGFGFDELVGGMGVCVIMFTIQGRGFSVSEGGGCWEVGVLCGEGRWVR